MNDEPISSLINDAPLNGVILDAGCGDCTYTKLLLNKNRKIVSLDIQKPDNSQIEGISFIVGTLENLPLKENVFDFIYCLSVIQLINDHKATIKEIHRILKPGGVFFFTVPTRYSPFKIIRELEIILGTYEFQQYNVQHHHYYTKRKLNDLIQGLFQIKRISGYQFNFFPRLLKLLLDVSQLNEPIQKVYRKHFQSKPGDSRTKKYNNCTGESSNNDLKRNDKPFCKLFSNHSIFSNFAYHFIIVLKKE